MVQVPGNMIVDVIAGWPRFMAAARAALHKVRKAGTQSGEFAALGPAPRLTRLHDVLHSGL
jgi:hypothetical protein